MNSHIKITFIACAITALSSCTSFMAATNDGSVHEDYGVRTMGSVVEDGTIESKVQINLSRHSEALEHANIGILSFNRIVLLTGQVPDAASKTHAGSVAEKVRHVRRVHNELEVMPSQNLGSRTSDSYLATKVGSNLLGTKGIDSGRIEVVVSNGKVFLMGLVTQEEAQRTINSIKEVSGLKGIVKVFEYIDNSGS